MNSVTSTATITVILSDVNDNTPQFTQTPGYLFVPRISLPKHSVRNLTHYLTYSSFFNIYSLYLNNNLLGN